MLTTRPSISALSLTFLTWSAPRLPKPCYQIILDQVFSAIVFSFLAHTCLANVRNPHYFSFIFSYCPQVGKCLPLRRILKPLPSRPVPHPTWSPRLAPSALVLQICTLAPTRVCLPPLAPLSRVGRLVEGLRPPPVLPVAEMTCSIKRMVKTARTRRKRKLDAKASLCPSLGSALTIYSGTEKKAGRRKIKIEFIQDKSRRHITFSKRKAGIMKKVCSPVRCVVGP